MIGSMVAFRIRRAPDLRCGKAAQKNGPALADPFREAIFLT
jgi:hypothetical protein